MAKYGNSEAANFLIANGANASAKTKDGKRPFDFALEAKHLPLFTALKEQEAKEAAK